MRKGIIKRMRYADLFGKTKRDVLSGITDPAHRLAYRAGLIRPFQNDQWLYLPLAAQVLARIQKFMIAELAELGAQRVDGMPQINLDALAAAEIQSYKQLPARLWWHSGGGTYVHLAALEANAEQALATVDKFEQVAARLFEFAGVDAKRADDIEQMHLLYSESAVRDFEILQCSSGDYAAARRAARPYVSSDDAHEALLPLQEVETPHSDTIESLARFLNVPTSRTAKAVFYSSNGQVIFAVIRGDLQIDEEKLKCALGVAELRFATDEEITRVGAVPGYASPVGTRGAKIVVDESAARSPNLVAGANRAGYHLLNTNVPRDYQPSLVTDIALASAGDRCPSGDGELQLVRGIELGSLQSPGVLNASFVDANGKAQKPYGIQLELDFGAVLLAHVGAHADDKGILWTLALAPFDVHIVALNADKPEVAGALLQLTAILETANLSYLLDDRGESAGVKFNDADLIGLPLRITIGPKTVAQQSIELKGRRETAARVVPLEQAGAEIEKWWQSNA